MTSKAFWTQRLFSGIVVAVLTLQPLAAAADAATDSPLQIVPQPREQRLLVSIGPLAMVAPGGRPATAETAVSGGRISRAAMLHRFSMELRDSAGELVPDGPRWEASVFAGTSAAERAGLRSLVQLSADAADISLPKPLGYRLEVGDSLLIVVRFASSAADLRPLVYLRLTIEYEPLEGPVSRLAVLALHADPFLAEHTSVSGVGASAVHRSWEWQPEVSGRILALTGRSLERASELVLEDLITGEVLWRTALSGEDAVADFRRPSQVVRLGVPVQQGGHYRLTAAYTPAAAEHAGDRAAVVRAMVFPNRTPTAVALAN